MNPDQYDDIQTAVRLIAHHLKLKGPHGMSSLALGPAVHMNSAMRGARAVRNSPRTKPKVACRTQHCLTRVLSRVSCAIGPVWSLRNNPVIGG